jgi:hypothetical protein
MAFIIELHSPDGIDASGKHPEADAGGKRHSFPEWHCCYDRAKH